MNHRSFLSIFSMCSMRGLLKFWSWTLARRTSPFPSNSEKSCRYRRGLQGPLLDWANKKFSGKRCLPLNLSNERLLAQYEQYKRSKEMKKSKTLRLKSQVDSKHFWGLGSHFYLLLISGSIIYSSPYLIAALWITVF